MKRLIEIIGLLPKWYGVILILIYAVLTAEFIFSLNRLNTSGKIDEAETLRIFMQINYGIIIVSSIIVWVVSCLLFHLMALLFDGKTKFYKFMFTASYSLLLPVIAMMAILLLDNMRNLEYDNVIKYLEQDCYMIQINVVNYSFVSCYLLVVCIIHWLYSLKWIYALLSVSIPMVSIYAAIELFEFIM